MIENQLNGVEINPHLHNSAALLPEHEMIPDYSDDLMHDMDYSSFL